MVRISFNQNIYMLKLTCRHINRRHIYLYVPITLDEFHA